MKQQVRRIGTSWTRTRMAMVLALASAAGATGAQSDEHGRKYKALPDTAHIVVTVKKGFNDKPLPNAAVIFHAVRDGHNDGNLEVKTDTEGRATIDVIEMGSHLTVQVIATGFATQAQEFDVTAPTKELEMKLLRPRGQVSKYTTDEGKASTVAPGVQEPPKPAAVRPPPAVKPNVPVETTPADTTPMAPPAATPTAPKSSGFRAGGRGLQENASR